MMAIADLATTSAALLVRFFTGYITAMARKNYSKLLCNMFASIIIIDQWKCADSSRSKPTYFAFYQSLSCLASLAMTSITDTSFACSDRFLRYLWKSQRHGRPLLSLQLVNSARHPWACSSSNNKHKNDILECILPVLYNVPFHQT